MHAISANDGCGLSSELSYYGTPFNEALTEYFTNKTFLKIEEKLPSYLAKESKCAYDRMVLLLNEFFEYYEDELKADYLINGQQKSLTSSAMGNLNFRNLINLINHYWILITSNELLAIIQDDKEFCRQYEQGLFKNCSKQNKGLYRDYYDTVKAIRNSCKKAIERKENISLQPKKFK